MLLQTNYVNNTPTRRRKTCVCHINMLKPYYAPSVPTPRSPGSDAVIVSETHGSNEGQSLCAPHSSPRIPRLLNSAMLPAEFTHLAEAQRELVKVIQDYPGLFSDVPTRTTILCLIPIR